MLPSYLGSGMIILGFFPTSWPQPLHSSLADNFTKPERRISHRLGIDRHGRYGVQPSPCPGETTNWIRWSQDHNTQAVAALTLVSMLDTARSMMRSLQIKNVPITTRARRTVAQPWVSGSTFACQPAMSIQHTLNRTLLAIPFWEPVSLVAIWNRPGRQRLEPRQSNHWHDKRISLDWVPSLKNQWKCLHAPSIDLGTC